MNHQIKEILSFNSKLTARTYQFETIETSFDLMINQHYHSILIESPTGSGKTLMGLILTKLLSSKLGVKRIGWVAMRKNLLIQAQEAAKQINMEDMIIPISMFDKNPPKVDILVVDEAHHDATVSMANLHQKIKPIKVIGLSATPLRNDKAELIFEKSVAKAGIRELVRLGYLAKPDLYILPDWKVETVTKVYLKDPKKWGKSVFFFFTMQECKEALSILEKNGIKAEIVHANSDKNKQIDLFEENKLDVLINMSILTEGFDCPSLETVFVRPSSKPLTMQMCGRVLRIFEKLRKKIVQSMDSEANFSKLAPIGRSFSFKNDDFKALDYDEELIMKIINNSNEMNQAIYSKVDDRTHLMFELLNNNKSNNRF